MPGNVLATMQALFLVKGTVTCPCLSLCHLTHKQHSTQLTPPSFLGQSTWLLRYHGFLVSSLRGGGCCLVSSGGLRAQGCPSPLRLPLELSVWNVAAPEVDEGKGFGASHAVTPHPEGREAPSCATVGGGRRR